MPPHTDPAPPRVYNDRIIHIESDNRCAPYSSQANQQSPKRIPLKMLGPNLLAWMKKRDYLTGQWILHSRGATLELIAATARKTKVFKHSFAACTLRQNVVNGHRLTGVRFGSLAIGAMTVVGSQ